jgi:hypothetical protein
MEPLLIPYLVPTSSKTIRRTGILIAILIGATAMPLLAQMTPEQRLLDFQVLASLYAKRYGPANWKMQSLRVNIFDIRPWVDRVRAAKTDIEYYETAAKFVATFRDGHTGYSTPSLFRADLGVYVDIYDDKVVIEQIVRSRLPVADYPFEVGDELVSLDGKPVEILIEELSSQQSYSNPRTTSPGALNRSIREPRNSRTNRRSLFAGLRATWSRTRSGGPRLEPRWRTLARCRRLSLGAHLA